MEQSSMTIKELAEKLGVSKTAIRKRLDEDFRRDYIKTSDDGVITINSEGCELISETFRKPVETHGKQFSETDENTVSTLIEMLQTELKIKNQQIEELNARLAESNAALVAAQQTAQAAQALHAGTIQQQLEAPNKKKRWWQRSKGE